MSDTQITPLPVPKEWWERLDVLYGYIQTDLVKDEIRAVQKMIYGDRMTIAAPILSAL